MKTKLLSILALLLVAVSGAWAQDTYNVTFKANGNTVTVENVTLPKTFSCDYWKENGELDQIIKQLYGVSSGYCSPDAPPSSGSENVTSGLDGYNQIITISGPFEGTATVTGNYFDLNGTSFDYSLEISIPGYVAKVNVTGVTLDKTSAEMTVGGEALTLTATVAPDNATDKTVAWTTSDASVATVADGVVTAVGAGTATITATAINGTPDDTSDDFSATCAVTVAEPKNYSTSFTAANAYTIEGGKASVSVDGGEATLDEEGKLPAINEGQTVTITAKPGYKFRKVAAEKEAAPEPEGDFVTFSDGTNTVKVATMNLGATSIADGTSSYGDYYACGATETFGTVAYTAYNEGTVTATKDGGYSQDNAPADFADVVTAKMGAGYRMPTKDDFKTLYAACGGTGEQTAPASISSGADYAQGIYWVAGATSAVTIGGDEYKANGVLFVQDATHHVFFPAAGYVEGTQLSFAGDYGFCWSSSLFTDVPIFAYNLFFRSSLVNLDYQFIRSNGLPVRPFKD